MDLVEIHSCQTSSTPPWRRELARAVRTIDELCDLLDLPETIRQSACQAGGSFPLLVPRGFVRRMRPGDPNDPLLLQVLPQRAEEIVQPGFSTDPVGDGCAVAGPGLLQKYQGRALLIVTGACAVHCRYCFRRHFPYEEAPRGIEAWTPALEAIARDASIHEVILSGGDPLVMRDEFLGELVRRLEGIDHLRRLRVHTRLPVVLPERIDAQMIGWLSGARLKQVVVIHANHPREIDGSVANAVERLRRTGALLFNQAVLLRGINDSADVLEELSERLLDIGVTPYYLHQLDRVRGAGHFELDEAEGRDIVAELRRRLPGYAVPRYVREVPGEPNKSPIGE